MKTQQISKITSLFISVGIVAGVSTSALANINLGTFNGSGISGQGDAISASAAFVDLGGGQLQITLANTESGDTGYIKDTLYGVFFSGATITGLASGDAAAGSKIWTYPSSGNATTPGSLGANTALTDPWQTDTLGSQKGIDAFTGSVKEGLVSTGFTGTQQTDGIANSQHQPLVESTAIFILTYSGTISSISSVKFLYNTALDSTATIPGTAVPEASTVIAGVLLLLPFGASILRILRKHRAVCC